jgi:hypothetical protein
VVESNRVVIIGKVTRKVSLPSLFGSNVLVDALNIMVFTSRVCASMWPGEGLMYELIAVIISLFLFLIIFTRIGRIADAAELNSKYLYSIDRRLYALEVHDLTFDGIKVANEAYDAKPAPKKAKIEWLKGN